MSRAKELNEKLDEMKKRPLRFRPGHPKFIRGIAEAIIQDLQELTRSDDDYNNVSRIMDFTSDLAWEYGGDHEMVHYIYNELIKIGYPALQDAAKRLRDNMRIR